MAPLTMERSACPCAQLPISLARFLASSEHFQYPARFATAKTASSESRRTHRNDSEKRLIRSKISHKTGQIINKLQKIIRSELFTRFSSGLDSKTHSEEPSSLTLFHQRKPTSRRPVTFFTVQKSSAASMVENMNM
eukprot:CAMPEP_0178438600 /NCGR_PEP_ID=MMETSP0689_2-20121128/35679_1 /TAXON_ID=160604 /ORGANISM="Amphidinium massartii, Strain CS-259" /LENGTH=135 /DNA_ID=CAMNT_0020061013 /DNA_START=1 /DNA_END=408 /DNA_ORIENTATION=+